MTKIKKIKRNEVGIDYIVGDIHGNFSKLRISMSEIGFDPEKDRLFSVGDLVDRGPESDEALDWLEAPWFFAVRGNHEDLAIMWAEGQLPTNMYMKNGGAWNILNTEDKCIEIADAFRHLPWAIELETKAGIVGIVHAECPIRSWTMMTQALEGIHGEQARYNQEEMSIWGRTRIERETTGPVEGVRAVVSGHTVVKTITRLDNSYFIDTGAWKTGNGQKEKPFVFLEAETLNSAEPLRCDN